MPDTLVSPDWLAERLDDPGLRIVEVNRDGTDDYDAGHIPGAVGVNWKAFLWDDHRRDFPAPEDIARRLGALGVTPQTTLVLYGQPVQFGTYGWWVLRYCGHPGLLLLDGGKTAWRTEGRPLTADRPQIVPHPYPPPVRAQGLRAHRDAVLAAVTEQSSLILDHRSPEEYRGERVSPPDMADHGAERGGRLPGARHVPYTALLTEDDRFRPESELRALFSEAGAGPDSEILSYCRLSHRATLASFAMTEILGFRNVRVYDGSWTEWGSMVGMPVER